MVVRYPGPPGLRPRLLAERLRVGRAGAAPGRRGIGPGPAVAAVPVARLLRPARGCGCGCARSGGPGRSRGRRAAVLRPGGRPRERRSSLSCTFSVRARLGGGRTEPLLTLGSGSGEELVYVRLGRRQGCAHQHRDRGGRPPSKSPRIPVNYLARQRLEIANLPAAPGRPAQAQVRLNQRLAGAIAPLPTEADLPVTAGRASPLAPASVAPAFSGQVISVTRPR